MAQRGPYHTSDDTVCNRTLKLLTTFILTPRELSCALDISTMAASTLLNRLWQQGRCQRWPHRDRSYRYMRVV